MTSVPLEDDSTFRGNRVIVFTAIWIPVQIICIALRYVARWLIKGPWVRDDFLIFTALFLQICQAGVDISAVKHGGAGHHLAYLEKHHPDQVAVWFKHLLALAAIYWVAVNLPKIAILCLYRRLFIAKWTRIMISIVMFVLIGMTIATFIVNFAECKPFAANWDASIPSACIDRNAFYIWTSIPNIATDLAILALPIPVVWNLHATRRTKILLTITFAVGSLGLVTSVIRFSSFFGSNSFTDSTWTSVEHMTWTQVEPGVYLISACLPTWRPLIEKILPRIIHPSKTSALGSNKKQTRGNDGIPLQAHRSSHGFQRLEDSSRKKFPHPNDITVTVDYSVVDHAKENNEVVISHDVMV
ncbi:uncharacterized protein EAF01_004117 [Botrytis porri]|uniref:Rhodopsin domain-containing protein n=1 Tax=Botrytis porri TaxID=87229 RepID=A0A4Z1KJ67_9HELO|nr:uncharacterized protein EAF01_004117 [Botrytis porri]KAF7908362.1 hypothetical protein EAF01_004117 [Botrytis porri]TGO86111.1 hypothetical protein BPOR_0334g00050 [Botrytis porri]